MSRLERQKDAPREAFWEPKWNPIPCKNEVEILVPDSRLLAAFWGESEGVLGGGGGAFSLIFYWFFYYFQEIDVFDADWFPRAIRERKRAKKGAKREGK